MMYKLLCRMMNNSGISSPSMVDISLVDISITPIG